MNGVEKRSRGLRCAGIIGVVLGVLLFLPAGAVAQMGDGSSLNPNASQNDGSSLNTFGSPSYGATNDSGAAQGSNDGTAGGGSKGWDFSAGHGGNAGNAGVPANSGGSGGLGASSGDSGGGSVGGCTDSPENPTLILAGFGWRYVWLDGVVPAFEDAQQGGERFAL